MSAEFYASIASQDLNAAAKELIKTRFDEENLIKVPGLEVVEVMDILGKHFNSFIRNCHSFPEYLEYLEKYGATWGYGFEICGPTQFCENYTERIDRSVAIQKEFIRNIPTYELKIKSKHLWLIAKDIKGHKYYYDTSFKGRGLIYIMKSSGKTHVFASDFTEFLCKINIHYYEYLKI